MRILQFVLIGLFFLCYIVKIESIFDLRYLRIGVFSSFLRVNFYIDEDAMFVTLSFQSCSCVFAKSLIGIFKLMDFVRTTDDVLEFPSGLTVAEVLPLYHVEPVHLHVQVQRTHIDQIDMVVGIFQESFPFVVLV